MSVNNMIQAMLSALVTLNCGMTIFLLMGFLDIKDKLGGIKPPSRPFFKKHGGPKLRAVVPPDPER